MPHSDLPTTTAQSDSGIDNVVIGIVGIIAFIFVMILAAALLGPHFDEERFR